MDLRWHIMVFDGSRRSNIWLLKPEVAVQLFLQAIYAILKGHLQIHLQQTSFCLDDIQHREALEVFLVKSIEAQSESDMTEGGCCS